MPKTILVTGATDGIGLETAKRLASLGHDVLLHGRNPTKLERAEHAVRAQRARGRVEHYVADLSRLPDVVAFADAVAEQRASLDVVINNAGVYRASEPITGEGLDVRFAVNAIAPYLLTQRLLSLLGSSARVINLSSAAQSPVNLRALTGDVRLSDNAAYAQSKLALTMWSRHLAQALGADGPVIVAVNPGSMLGTKMVKDAFGVAGGDIGIGADILVRAALTDEFAAATGAYFDNDAGRFCSPHPDAIDPDKTQAIVNQIETVLTDVRDKTR